MKVAKFGGTSLASAAQIKKVCDIVLADAERKVVVVSAPGKRDKNDTKVTDLLIALAERYLAEGEAEAELAAVVARYRDIAEGLALSEELVQLIEADLRERLALDRSKPEMFMDAIKASGEDNNAKVVARYLQSKGVQARYVNPKEAGLFVSEEHGNAQVLAESYENLKALRHEEGIQIFPGFFGYSPSGELVTFSRGGSDITGSILAAAVEADLYENFTDVDSVFSANPNIVADPQPIQKLTYREMRELSYAGFSVFHDEALIPAFRAGIPVCIKNTNNPAAPGTMIVFEREGNGNPVVGIASDGGFCSIYVSKYLMNREIGFGRRLLHILEDEDLSYEHIPSGIDDISVILKDDKIDDEVERRITERVRTELAVDDIVFERDMSMIMLVGEGMRHNVGTTARAASALARAHVNIEMINQGSSEVSMMFAVKAVDEQKAVRAIYEEFFSQNNAASETAATEEAMSYR
ncbi:aspartate kinase [Aneurinibacillus aneurinilyticus]|jgi:aspartate kinase|uniref:Aspartokinase n=1 Tax=Aneurinibacillus aneurinilyticus ATCC 12856 TaxID=649747 RepID=U1XZX4_ANEAE|nr:aspartate kinase [Aneurinibacillus aneurinilyticus]ERI04276.1 aspartate kinase [Aneurinibacillus aneurinilyticus ATCC 12856]MCI1692756.1 aspartate kinase [Aneurinibacillus aneurinilyticus]MED0708340.1 aspartate kinase [Aneurinibacillus aneurinilyticus]MED0722072.1 aspartate kinase [Aneurinibacillus aneurinilyticus]MED0733354.1 aspartate kinase [Aneurinibacillus aneurinilyticus]